jgi:hypothetical protein
MTGGCVQVTILAVIDSFRILMSADLFGQRTARMKGTTRGDVLRIWNGAGDRS